MMLSVACGILAVLCALIYADSVRQETEQVRTQALERYGGEVTNLVVARAGLSSGDVIKQTDVEVREWLVDLAPQEALSTLDDVVGLRLTSAVAAGAPLSRVDFARVDGEIEIPEGRVAVSVHLSDKTGVSDTLTSGSRLLAYEVTATNTVLISNDIVVVGERNLPRQRRPPRSPLRCLQHWCPVFFRLQLTARFDLLCLPQMSQGM